jgi:hypothetical protein
MHDFGNCADFQNHVFRHISNFSPKRAGRFINKPAPDNLLQVVQTHDISLQNFALSAIADHL